MLEIKSEHRDGVIRRELAPAECGQQADGLAALARPYLQTDVCERYCNAACTKEGCGAGAVRRIRQHGQDIPLDRADQSFSMSIPPRRSWRGAAQDRVLQDCPLDDGRDKSTLSLRRLMA
ncbi:hypothetical protein RZS28_01290 [Methylocapsa polymorpha]|uniref:Uncharacterized protein n=1 Tax=Methylocapsa polymorpha TaxID=3080828 RepID=A0ABZ0HTU1_9HYPH|nr:hypothetical protein RZS28_01290 [Methylocapsa sp. RX1]